MSITILHSDDTVFDASFLKQLPSLEKTMIEHDLDPSAFTIAKSRSGAYHSYGSNASHHDYTVTTGEDTFTVTYANDQGFLDFFLASCISDDEPEGRSKEKHKTPSKDHQGQSLLGRVSGWLAGR